MIVLTCPVIMCNCRYNFFVHGKILVGLWRMTDFYFQIIDWVLSKQQKSTNLGKLELQGLYWWPQWSAIKKYGHKIYNILGKEEIFKKIKLTEQYTNLIPSILSYTRKRGPWEQGCIEHQPYCLSFQLSVELHQRFPQQCTAPINTKKWWSFIVSQSSVIICTRSQCLPSYICIEQYCYWIWFLWYVE